MNREKAKELPEPLRNMTFYYLKRQEKHVVPINIFKKWSFCNVFKWFYLQQVI